MKYLKQFLIIISVSFAGEVCKVFIPLPVAASVWGVILMFLLLELKIIKVSDVKETSAFLIEIMPVMFVPAAVGLIDSFHLIKPNLIAYIVITFAVTFIVMAVSGLVCQKMLKGGEVNE